MRENDVHERESQLGRRSISLHFESAPALRRLASHSTITPRRDATQRGWYCKDSWTKSLDRYQIIHRQEKKKKTKIPAL